MNGNQNTRKLVLYLLIVLGLTGGIYGIMFASGGRESTNPIGFLLNWAPGIAAIIAALITQRNLRGFGWGWGKHRYNLLAWVVSIAVVTISYVVIWLTGLGGFYDEASLVTVAVEMDMVDSSPYLIILSLFLVSVTANILIHALLSIGEEIGWRGWLVPLLANRYNFTYTALISGVIWVSFHLPLILLLGEESSYVPTWYVLVNLFIQGIAISLVVAWLRLKSGSL